MKFPQSTLECQLVLSLCRSYLGNHIVELSWVQHACHVLKTLSSSKHQGPLTLTILPLCSAISPSPRCKDCIADVSVRAGQHSSTHPLHFLGLSNSFHMLQKKFCVYKDRYLEYSLGMSSA